MVKIIPIAVMAFLIFSSCSTYQYATISSSTLSMNGLQEFEFENDTVRIIYNFYGENAPVTITIKNKLSVPIFVDWHNSSLNLNGRSVSYAPPQMPQSDDFVPPHSYLTRNPIGITNTFIENVPAKAYQKVQYSITEGYRIPVKAVVFTEGSSPLLFKSYLSLSIGNRDAWPVAYEHSFFVSQLLRSKKGPGTMWSNGNHRGNQYFVTKMSNGVAAVNAVVGTLAGGVLIIGGTVLGMAGLVN